MKNIISKGSKYNQHNVHRVNRAEGPDERDAEPLPRDVGSLVPQFFSIAVKIDFEPATPQEGKRLAKCDPLRQHEAAVTNAENSALLRH